MPEDDNGPTWNPEHLEVVMAGKDAIDEYRATGLGGARLSLIGADLTSAILPGAKLPGPTLTGAELIAANLRGPNLNGAELWGANLSDANLPCADLRGANLTGADLTGANLTDADLRGANLRGANLTGANLTDAELDGADLTDQNLAGANLRGAHLTGANLWGANLSGANLNGANLTDANLAEANLRGAFLLYAGLEGANLSDSHGARFDGHDLSTVKLHRASYPWLTLRRQYSGPMVLLHALILLLFFSPFIARGAMHLAGTKMVEVAQAATDAAARRIPEVPTVDLAQKLGLEPAPLWSVLLQWDRSPLLAALVAVLVAYAALRFFLVWRVAPMREEEERIRHTPPLKGYWRLIVPHRVVRILFWISLASTLWHAVDWLRTSVLVER